MKIEVKAEQSFCLVIMFSSNWSVDECTCDFRYVFNAVGLVQEIQNPFKYHSLVLNDKSELFVGYLI